MSEVLLTMATAWFPEAYVDEIMPADRAHPNEWIVKKDGVFYLAACDDLAEPPEKLHKLEEGERMRFTARLDFGHANLTLNPDGTYSVDRPMPDGADTVWATDDHDYIDADVASLVENSLKDDIGTEPQTFDLAYYSFDDCDFIFSDGAFHLVEAAVVQ